MLRPPMSLRKNAPGFIGMQARTTLLPPAGFGGAAAPNNRARTDGTVAPAI